MLISIFACFKDKINVDEAYLFNHNFILFFMRDLLARNRQSKKYHDKRLVLFSIGR
jgi:hypothetical protein